MKFLMPLIVLVAGIAAAALFIVTGPEIQPQPSELVAPLVRFVVADPQTRQLSVRTHGTVVPRTESELVPEVDGRVIEMSPALVSGGFFSKGDVLFRIDPLDYEVGLEQARAGLARAKSDLANARRNHSRVQNLATRGSASDAQRDDALNRVMIAEATLRETTARLARAERDLSRTKVVAPYDGRVRSERVDIGQFVKRGTAVGVIYAVDYAEVRLPIHDHELAYLDLLLAREGQEAAPPVPVTLRAQFAGKQHQWLAKVVRTEGELDPTTRMVHVVARVPNPYASGDGRPPLAVGLFVDAEIHGQTLADVVVLPRSSLRGGNQVLLIDDSNQLRLRVVDVLRIDDDLVFVTGGLQRGDRVCVSTLQSTTDGMQVRVVEEPSGEAVVGSAEDVSP